MRTKMKARLGAGLAAALVLAALGCQTPMGNGGAPWVIVSAGRLTVHHNANIALVLDAGEAFAKLAPNRRLQQVSLGQIVQFKVRVTGENLAAPIERTLGPDSCDAEGNVTLELGQLPAGSIHIVVNALDENGNIVSYASRDVVVVGNGTTQVVEMQCERNFGEVKIRFVCDGIQCPSLPPETASPNPSPSPIPSPAPSFPANLENRDIQANSTHIFMANYVQGGSITKYDLNGNPVQRFNIPGLSGIHSLCFSETGTIWCVANGNGQAAEISPVDGSIIRGPIRVGSIPLRIRKSPNNDIWTTGTDVYRISPSGNVLGVFNIVEGHDIDFTSTHAWITGISGQVRLSRIPINATSSTTVESTAYSAWGIDIVGNQGFAWLAGFQSSKIDKKQLDQFPPVQLSQISAPSSTLTVFDDESGGVWVTLPLADLVIRYNAAGQEIYRKATPDFPTALTKTPDGRWWAACRSDRPFLVSP